MAQVAPHEYTERQLEPAPNQNRTRSEWKVKGYVRGGNTDARQTVDHYRLFVENPELLGFYLETDWPSGFNGSWLKELHVDIPLTEDKKTKFQVGRIFQPGASVYGPGPDSLRFVNYQHAPRAMSFYGWGGKFLFDLGNNMDAQLAFTGSCELRNVLLTKIDAY
ncbi:MAG: hypothetical protein HZA95_04035 [Candidatus Vogelbacteria bacterium]|nr:hypothetical protein [Candidatus Vogelbacteria bacterium]